jgi:DMSO reductase anchor subunit
VIVDIGAFCFGLVVGWITYRTLRRKEGSAALSDIATVIGVIGGATVTGVFATEILFAWYSIGLTVGFFAYLIIAGIIGGREELGGWMGD